MPRAQYGTACSLMEGQRDLETVVAHLEYCRISKFNVYVYPELTVVVIRQAKDAVAFCARTGATVETESDGARYYPDRTVMDVA